MNCSSCRVAYKGLNALEVVLQLISIASLGIFAARKQSLVSGAARVLVMAMAILCFAASRWLSHFIYKNFHFHDYNHALRWNYHRAFCWDYHKLEIFVEYMLSSCLPHTHTHRNCIEADVCIYERNLNNIIFAHKFEFCSTGGDICSQPTKLSRFEFLTSKCCIEQKKMIIFLIVLDFFAYFKFAYAEFGYVIQYLKATNILNFWVYQGNKQFMTTIILESVNVQRNQYFKTTIWLLLGGLWKVHGLRSIQAQWGPRPVNILIIYFSLYF